MRGVVAPRTTDRGPACTRSGDAALALPDLSRPDQRDLRGARGGKRAGTAFGAMSKGAGPNG